MNKPASLREAITAALPDLKKNPDRLLVFIDKGQIVSTQAPNFSFEYHYTVNLILIDYSKHADTVFIPMLVWVRENQPDLLTGEADDGMSFEAEMLDHETSDISITLRLTERVIVTQEGNKLVSTHAAEPKLMDLTGPVDWNFYANGDEALPVPLEIEIV